MNVTARDPSCWNWPTWIRAAARPDGTRPGLSITARIVEEHAGPIEIDDAPGGGAQFRVLLPLAKGSN